MPNETIRSIPANAASVGSTRTWAPLAAAHETLLRSGCVRLLALSLFLCGAASAEGEARTVIHAGHLLADPAKPALEQQSIIIENGKINSIVPGFVEGGTVIDLSTAWLMPGLIDMHTHVTVTLDLKSEVPWADFMPSFLGRPAARVLASEARAQRIMRGGFTTIRNLGDPASVTYDLRDAINSGVISGPRIIGCEPMFGVAGGDYDAFVWGERQDLEPLFKTRGMCSGVTDCERAVREEVHRGAGVIKLRLASQTFIDPKSEPMETPAEITAIISTAHRLNRRVATHSAGSSVANQWAIDAGTDTLEHGPISDANIAAMLKHGTAYVPTLLTVKLATENPKIGITADYYRQATASVGKAYKSHVPILFGTDLPIVPIDREWEEFLALQDAGLTSIDALRSATTSAAAALGMADTLGSIEAGKAADLIAVGRDPRADLHEMGKVIFVMKGGKTIRDDSP